MNIYTSIEMSDSFADSPENSSEDSPENSPKNSSKCHFLIGISCSMLSCEFTIFNPTAFTKEKWIELAKGESGIIFSDREEISQILIENDHYHFITVNSGEDRVGSRIIIPVSDMRPHLQALVDLAIQHDVFL